MLPNQSFIMEDLTTILEDLKRQIQLLRENVIQLKQQRDEYKGELENMYHAWYRLDLEDWGAERGIDITDKLWRDWCTFWMDIYNLQYEQEAMKQAMDDWWESRHS